MLNRRIVYILSDKLIEESNSLQIIRNRASIVQDLINSYNLLETDNLTIINSPDATLDELKSFHSSAYLEFLEKLNLSDSDENHSDAIEEEKDEFGLNYDCASFKGIFNYVKAIAGSSIEAAKLLVNGNFDVAINWFGGWHHAQRDVAEGFCYVNDIVIAIQKLTEKFKRVLYVDLDIHHGNGVQNAFEFSKRILTLSFHKYSPGFYPGSGSLNDIGVGKGKYYSLNVPFLEGVSDKSYIKVFNAIYPKVFEKFEPDVMVVQCGADGLCGDKLGEANLTLNSFVNSIKQILNSNIPVLFLGGGGYNFSNTARLWATLTGIILNKELNENIPDTAEYFTKYGPTYELQIESSFMKDRNSDQYLEKLIETLNFYCQFIENAQ